MAGHTQKPLLVRFGVFEANLSSAELHKHGLQIRIPGQPFKILAILLERPGEVVTREELRKGLWSSETFVDFEHSLNSAVKKLREALGDSAESPRYIETLPRVGYRFIAPVTVSPGTDPEIIPEPDPAPSERPPLQAAVQPKQRARILMSAAVFIAAGAVVAYAVRSVPPPLTDQDSIVLADFENRTGDPAFDGTLKKVLEVEIGQSPYLNVLPDQDVRRTLEAMRRRPDEPVTRPVGLEICQRNASKAMISGMIAGLGNRYVLTLEAVNCATSGVIAGTKEEAESKEKVLRTLDDASAKIRRKLGESLASVRKFGVPIEEATTGSLDALKMFALGDDLRREGKNAESVPFFKQATELDPQFTLAYGRLGAVYANLDENELAKEYVAKAFELRERTSERERLYLAARYYDNVSGEAGKLIETYDVWKNAYARDWIPVNNLGNEYTKLGQYGKAIEAGREAVKLNPNHSFPYAVLARAYKRANRYAESKAICENAIAKHLDGYGIHSILYQIAFAEGDAAAMKRQEDWGAGKSTESETLVDEALAAATAGRLHDSRELFRRAFATARHSGLSNNAASAAVTQATVEAAFDNLPEARERATAAMAVEGAKVSDDAALVLAAAGDLTRAESLAAELGRQYPLDTLINEVSVPRIRAEAEIRRGNPAHAIDLLRDAAPYELRDFTVPYIRGSGISQQG